MDYTTVDRVKTYLGIDKPGADGVIASLIPVESRLIERYCANKFGALTSRSATLAGSGSDRLALPDRPIVSVSSVTVCGQALKYDPTGRNIGFSYDDTLVYLNLGQRFSRGVRDNVVSWVSGYQGSEYVVIPDDGSAVIPSDIGRAVSVVSIMGAVSPLTAIPAGAPSSGEYVFDRAKGTFVFSTADAGTSVLVTYVAIPSPIEQAANEMVGLDLKQRDNLGISSKSLAGESITYSDKAMTASTKTLLDAYRVRWGG